MNAVQHDLDLQSMALLEIGRALQRDSYAFVTITPQTHRRINERAQAVGCGQARTLRDVFGWCRPFSPSLLPRRMLELLMTAGQVEQVERPEGVDGEGPWLRSKVRFSTAEDQLFVHSAHPTTEQDAVFFGPDTYRFRSLIRQRAPRYARYVVDVCGGSGAGAMVLARRAERLAVADVNRMALRLAAINATLAGVTIDVLESDVLDAVEEPPDPIVANPPYMKDARHRAYRDRGGEHGRAGRAGRVVAVAAAPARGHSAALLRRPRRGRDRSMARHLRGERQGDAVPGACVPGNGTPGSAR